MKGKLLETYRKDELKKDTFFIHKAQNIFEILFIGFIFTSSLHPYHDDSLLRIYSEIIALCIAIFFFIIYFIRAQKKIIKPSHEARQELWNGIKVGIFCFFVIFILIFFMNIWRFLTGNMTYSPFEPRPTTIWETIGRISSIPAMGGVFLFPLLRMVCFAEKSSGLNKASFIIAVFTLMGDILFNSYLVLAGGFILSKSNFILKYLIRARSHSQ